MVYIAAVQQWSAQTGGNCCGFTQHARGIRSPARIIKSSAPGLKNGFNDFWRIACYAIFRRCFYNDKRNVYPHNGAAAKLPDSESDLAKELLNTLKCAFPDVYDWILWWLAKPDNFAVWTADETQRRNLGDAASLYNFISTPEAQDGTLQGNDISMLSLVVSRTTREYLDDYVFGTGLNFQEFLCILINWLLKHPGEVKRIIHTDMFWTRRDYRGDFAHIPSYEPIYRDAFKRDCDEILDSVFRGVIPQRIRNDDGSMAMLIPCGAENSN